MSVARGTQGSRFQPPRKRSANTAEPTIMLAYSATKKRDHLKAPYSVWNPPTRSDSDSGMSKGWRLVSANRATAKMSAETGIVNRNHEPPQNPARLWNSTTRARLSEPDEPGSFTQRNTGSTESVIESSYEISCAEARMPPRNGYFELEAQP